MTGSFCHSRWILLFRFLITGFLVTIIFQSYAQQRITVNLQSNWRFFQGSNNTAHLKDFDDSKWPTVTIPHDWAIAGPFIPEGDGILENCPGKEKVGTDIHLNCQNHFPASASISFLTASWHFHKSMSMVH